MQMPWGRLYTRAATAEPAIKSRIHGRNYTAHGNPRITGQRRVERARGGEERGHSKPGVDHGTGCMPAAIDVRKCRFRTSRLRIPPLARLDACARHPLLPPCRRANISTNGHQLPALYVDRDTRVYKGGEYV